MRNRDPTFYQQIFQTVQCEVWHIIDLVDDEIAMRIQNAFAMTAEFRWRDAACLAQSL